MSPCFECVSFGIYYVNVTLRPEMSLVRLILDCNRKGAVIGILNVCGFDFVMGRLLRLNFAPPNWCVVTEVDWSHPGVAA